LPDLTFLLRISGRTGIDRIHANRHGIKLFDKEQLLNRIAENYDMLAQRFGDGVTVLNGNESTQVIAGKIQETIRKIL